jgi:hypothetical protein
MEVENFKPYSSDILPQGFKYPIRYLALSNDIAPLSTIPNFRWWFINSENEVGKLAYELRKNGLNLIPFAQLFDWAAYFDGDDTTGNPMVYVFDLGDMPYHMIFKDFSEWLEKASTF